MRTTRQEDPLVRLDHQSAVDRFANALDTRLFAAPSPLPLEISAGREIKDGQIRYTLCHATFGYLGEVVVQPRDEGLEYRVNVAGHPDDPMSQQREALLLPLATAMQARLEEGGPVRVLPGVVYHRLALDAVYQPPSETAARLILCRRCQQLMVLLIDAEQGYCLEDYARALFAIYREKNLPTFVVSPHIEAAPHDAVRTDILQVWRARKPIERVSIATVNTMFEELSRAHCVPTIRM